MNFNVNRCNSSAVFEQALCKLTQDQLPEQATVEKIHEFLENNREYIVLSQNDSIERNLNSLANRVKSERQGDRVDDLVNEIVNLKVFVRTREGTEYNGPAKG